MVIVIAIANVVVPAVETEAIAEAMNIVVVIVIWYCNILDSR